MAKHSKKKPVQETTPKKKAAGKNSTPTGKGTKSAPDLEERLKKILDTPKSAKKCLAFVRPLSEKQRRAIAPMCSKVMKSRKNNAWVVSEPGSYSRHPLFDAATIAFFATANFTEVKRMGFWGIPSDAHSLDILASRKPDWIPQFLELRLASDSYWGNWDLIRELVKRKLCKKPTTERYYTAMIGGLGAVHLKKTVFSRLKSDPDLLKDEVWRLFEYEGDSQNSLANVDRWEQAGWAEAMIKLCKSGLLPRKRLLDSALSALGLGFNHYRSRWFFDFFDALKPTPKEIKDRADTILNLLNSPTPNVAKWALVKVERLIEAGAFKDTNKLIASLRPMLMAQANGTVTSALSLLKQIATNQADTASAVALAATEALGHEKAAVQKSAFKLILEFGKVTDAKVYTAVEKYQPLIAASFKKQIAKWLDSTATDSKSPTKNQKSKSNPKPTTFDRKRLKGLDQSQVEKSGLSRLVDSLGKSNPPIPSATFDGTDIPRLSQANRISPIIDLEDLIDSCARVIEDGQRIDEAERVVDGLSRLCDQRPDGFDTLTGPLFKRVKKLLKQQCLAFSGDGVEHDVAGLVYCWLKQATLKRRSEKRENEFSAKGYDVLDSVEIEGKWVYAMYTHQHIPTPNRFLADRIAEVAERVANSQPQTLLSAPTHQGAWVDPRELVDRINKLEHDPTEIDLVLAMLRLAPDGKALALKKLKPKLGSKLSAKLLAQWLPAVKHALGAEKIKIGKSAPLWIAAARSRSPWGDIPALAKAHPNLTTDCGTAAVYKTSFTSETHKYEGESYSHRRLKVGTTERPSKKRAANVPTELMHRLTTNDYDEQDGVPYADSHVLALASIWPVARESYFAVGASKLGHNLDWHEANWHHRIYMLPLLDANTPLREMGLFLLMCGLAAKEPGEYGLATDIAIQAIDDGRLGTDNLGDFLAKHISCGHFNLSRWAKRFTDIAAASELHSYVMLRACEAAHQGNLDVPPRGLADIVELMVELGSQLESGVATEDCRRFLGQVKGSSKLAKNAKAFLAIETRLDEQVILEQAITKRLARIATWTK